MPFAKISNLDYNRRLAFLIAGVGFFVAFVWRESESVLIGAVSIAVLSAMCGLFVPTLISPLAAVWMKIGVVVGNVMGPIVLGVFFYVIFSPVAVLRRLKGADPLALRRGARESMWQPHSENSRLSNISKSQY